MRKTWGYYLVIIFLAISFFYFFFVWVVFFPLPPPPGPGCKFDPEEFDLSERQYCEQRCAPPYDYGHPRQFTVNEKTWNICCPREYDVMLEKHPVTNEITNAVCVK